jgi:hypothetical protein
VDNEIPSWCAFAAVAPAVRFRAFAILATPIFFLARDLNSRKSEAVHERRVGFFLLAGIIGSLIDGARLLPMAEARAATGQECFDFPHTRTLETQRAKGEDGADTTDKASQLGDAEMAVMVIRSIAQIELHAKPMGNFFRAPLISDQVARRGNYIGLPPVGMILANSDLQTGHSDFRCDHLSETSCGDAFLEHDKSPENGRNNK